MFSKTKITDQKKSSDAATPLVSDASSEEKELSFSAPFSRSKPAASVLSEDLKVIGNIKTLGDIQVCLLYTSPSPRDGTKSRMPSSA